MLPEINLLYKFGYNGIGKSSELAQFLLQEKEQRSWSTGIQVNIPFPAERLNKLASERLKLNIAD